MFANIAQVLVVSHSGYGLSLEDAPLGGLGSQHDFRTFFGQFYDQPQPADWGF